MKESMVKKLFFIIILCFLFSSCFRVSKIYYVSETYIIDNKLEQKYKNMNFENVDVAFRMYKIIFPDDNLSFGIVLRDDAPFYDRYGRESPYSLHMYIRADSDNDIDYIVINGYKVFFANIDRIFENNQFNYFIKNKFDDSLKYVNNGYNDGYYPNDILKKICSNNFNLKEDYDFINTEADLRIFNNIEYIEILFDITYSLNGIVKRHDITIKYFPQLGKKMIHLWVGN
jgi:hypothetical protein